MVAKVDPNTLHSLPWAGNSKHQVGEVLAECFWKTGESHGACTRTIAKNMLKQLDEEFGLELMSSYEYEFLLMDEKSGEPVFRGKDIFSHQLLSEFEGYLYDMERLLSQSGVDVESFMTEYADGQFEIATAPQQGITPAEQGFFFKEGVKEVSKKYGYQATFMTKPSLTGCGNGCHYNHSLWSTGDKRE